ncbi:hypothetical protein [Nocardioides psychrotolerans]|uniref:hypothetical protein n=1 Tax=Nocardioides psychrotolerans TaxID=1005945 RepID=UPI0031380EE4
MTYDDTDLIEEAPPSPTERQLRRLMVPRPAAYVAEERLDVINDPDLEQLWRVQP